MSEVAHDERRTYKVTSVTQQEIELLHQREVTLYEGARDQYLAQYQFTHENDYRTLDRLLLLEVQFARFQWWTAAGKDYGGTLLIAKEESDYRRAMKEILAQITEVQNSLGVTKAQREKQGADSVGGYLIELRQRAKAHGVKREKELGKAIELVHELLALTGAFQRSNAHERSKLGFDSADDVVTWVEEYLRPEFEAVDAYFREHEQRFWIRQQ